MKSSPRSYDNYGQTNDIYIIHTDNVTKTTDIAGNVSTKVTSQDSSHPFEAIRVYPYRWQVSYNYTMEYILNSNVFIQNILYVY